MKVLPKRSVVRVTAAGLALGLVVAGCSKDDEKSSSSATPATSSATTSATTAAPTSAAASADYSSLLIKAEAIPNVGGAFTAAQPELNPGGVSGVTQKFATANNSEMIEDTIIVADSPDQAGAILAKTKEGLGSTVTATPAPLPSVSPDASVLSGVTPDGSKGVVVLVFTEQNAVVTLEFDNAPGDLQPAPTDFVETVGVLQQDAVRTGLPNLPSPAAPAGAPAPAAAGGSATLTIGGTPSNVTGPVVCNTDNGKFSIAVGDLGTGFIVGLEPDASAVHNVGLPMADNGLVLAFTEGAPGNDAKATKDGNTYQITGTATGTDNANNQVSKPFEINATCP
jgi:Mycobacterium 19 kDa lipoprotein antigen